MEKYSKQKYGIISQLEPETFIYNKDYIKTYEALGEEQMYLSFLRYSIILNKIDDSRIKSVLDIGYGDGSFLKACNFLRKKTYGHDVSGYPLPQGSTFVDNIFDIEVDLITMFDVLEHIKDITFVKNLKCKYLLISVPNLPTRLYKSEEFLKWKHRKPNEHLHHFDANSLTAFLIAMGYSIKTVSYIEDTIRRPTSDKPNILSVLCEKVTS